MPTKLYPIQDGPTGMFPNSPAPYIAAVVFEVFLYGIYIALFCFSLTALLRVERLRLFWLISITTLFAVASADIGYTVYLVLARLLIKGLTYEDLRPKYVMYVINSVIATTLLLYRCYFIWNSRIYVVIGPAVLLIAATLCGFVFEGTTIALLQYSWINVVLTVAVNVITTTLSAGRIFYISRSMRVMLGNVVSKRYHTVVLALIGSGSIYTVYVSFNLLFWNHSTAHLILDAGLIQVVSITPTLLIVQGSLEQSPARPFEPAMSYIPACGSSNLGSAVESTFQGDHGETLVSHSGLTPQSLSVAHTMV